MPGGSVLSQNTTQKKYDVLGVGSSIVDILGNCEDRFISEIQANKGTMHLVDQSKILNLTERIKSFDKVSGGSVANTMVGLASFGAQTAFIGKINNDDLGNFFAEDIRSQGVFYRTTPLDDLLPTARCIVLITPDAERTMFTYLGASGFLSSEDIKEHLIAESEILYIEGYQWDIKSAREGIINASKKAARYKTKVALTLSDPFVVERHRDSLIPFIKQFVDILLCNEEEIKSLFQSLDLDMALLKIKPIVEVAAVTCGNRGAYTIEKDKPFLTPAFDVPNVLDTTGAGDMFAAGFLYGYVNKQKGSDSALLGNLAASEIITHLGARPNVSLATLSEKVNKF